MTKWIDEEPVDACPTCGVDCKPWRGDDPGIGDPRDDAELQSAWRAVALQAHRYDVHRVEVSIGDLVRYWAPWRGRILGSEVYRVDGIWEDQDHSAFARSMGADVDPMIGTSYTLTNPSRRDDRCFPFVGDPRRPITFELVESAPVVETDLMDLLGWETADA